MLYQFLNSIQSPTLRRIMALVYIALFPVLVVIATVVGTILHLYDFVCDFVADFAAMVRYEFTEFMGDMLHVLRTGGRA